MFARVLSLLRRAAASLFWSSARARRPFRLILPVAVWVALVLNLSVLQERWALVWAGASGAWPWLGPLGEIAMVFGATSLLLILIQLLGNTALRVAGVLLLIVSALCAYFMTRFKVVIGFGVLSAVFTTDHDMSREVVGGWLLAWVILLGVLPAIGFWRRSNAVGLARGWRERRWWWAQGLSLLASGLLLGCGQTLLERARQDIRLDGGPDANPVGTAAHSYVPSNWIAGSGMVLANSVLQARGDASLKQPAELFHFEPQAALERSVVVLVIGETTRSDRMGIFGHARDTTPHLAAEPHVAAFRGWSCDTSTKLSLRCMFVRPEGLVAGKAGDPDLIVEDNVFSVYKRLGFGIELFSMQSEVGFYSSVRPDLIKFREIIAAQPENAERRLDDALLVPELRASLARQGKAPLLVVLHTKGSHAMYSQRYPLQFSVWTPECIGTDDFCERDELLNAFDNSVLYVDYVLNELRRELKSRKALMVYVSDHGESIDDKHHFHATPRHIAPPEQRRVPLVFWASEAWRADPVLGERYAHLEARAEAARALPMDDKTYGHRNLFASLLGCMGVASSDGGVSAATNLCAP